MANAHLAIDVEGLAKRFAGKVAVDHFALKVRCPHRPLPPSCDGIRKTVYRFGVPASDVILDS